MEKAPTTLAKKLVDVMKAIDNVPKNGRNEFHKYDYATEFDILKSVRGKLADLGVIVLTSVEGANKQGEVTEVTTKHTFIDSETGETLEVKGYGQGKDSGDKGGYKGVTGATKQFLTKNFMIPTGDDPEADNPETNGRNGRAKKPAENGKPATNGNASTGEQNGNGALGPDPTPKQQTRAPDASTPHQQGQIKKLAEELGLNVEKDIYAKMKITSAPSKKDAERILKRLNDLKTANARK